MDPRVAALVLYALPLERAFGFACDGRRAVRRATGHRSLIAVSPQALREGVRVGMSVVEARARVAELEVREERPAEEHRLLAGAAEVLLGFSPDVEIAEPDVLLVDVGRSRRMLADRGLHTEAEILNAMVLALASFGHRAAAAMADDPDTARTLAQSLALKERLAQRKTKTEWPIAAPGAGAKAIGGLPLPAIAWTDLREDPEAKRAQKLDSTRATLELLGVHTPGHLASFPADQVASRFGEQGVLLMARARAERRRPLVPFVPATELVEGMDLPGPMEDLEPLLFVLKRLLDRLESRLYARGLSASALELRFRLEPSRKTEKLKVMLARPSRSAVTFHRLCRERVSGALSGAIAALEVEVIDPVPEHGAQLDLFTAHAQRIEKVEELVARLQASLGEDAVFSAELTDTHRPEAAWVARPFAIERALAEPPAPMKKTKRAPVLVAGRMGKAEALPVADEQLSVLGQKSAAITAPEPKDPKSWPKPFERKKEDEALPPLPPRPFELFPTPEAAQLTAQGLRWRGRRHRVASVGRRERFDCEWWRPDPLVREYVVLELEDGRRLWSYAEPSAPADILWIHGIFD
ncbi:MAG: hypothetical protein U1E65_16020 [Myxococcota bacterium]